MSEHPRDPALTGLEAALAGLAPTPPAFDRDRLLFRAGQESAPRQGRVVELRFFGGCSEEEIAKILGVSVRTVKRDWRVARAWLFAELGKK